MALRAVDTLIHPYKPIFATPHLRRVMSGIGISSLGDGLSTVAISLLALSLASHAHMALAVAAALAAYNLPGAIGTFILAPWMRGRRGAQLATWDAELRTAALLVIPILYLAGGLNIPTLVLTLGASSLLNAWGKAGRYALLSELLPTEHRLAGNAAINLVLEISYVAGPPVAAALLTVTNPAFIIGIDALTFATLGATYRLGLPAALHDRTVPPQASRAEGFAAIRRHPQATALVAISFLFYLLFGLIPVSLPLYVVGHQHKGAGSLAGYLTAFGLGGFLGALTAGYLGRRALLPLSMASILGVGLFAVPLALSLPTVFAWVLFGVAGVFWGPFPSTSTALFQSLEEGAQLTAMLAARTALQVFALPAGTLIGGALSAATSARTTLLVSGVCITTLGLTGFITLKLTGKVDVSSNGGVHRQPRSPSTASD